MARVTQEGVRMEIFPFPVFELCSILTSKATNVVKKISVVLYIVSKRVSQNEISFFRSTKRTQFSHIGCSNLLIPLGVSLFPVCRPSRHCLRIDFWWMSIKHAGCGSNS